MGKTGVASARVLSEMYREKQLGDPASPSASSRGSPAAEGDADRRPPDGDAAERRREP